MPARPAPHAAALTLLAAALLVCCGSGGGTSRGTTAGTTRPAPAPTGTVTVLAAASLTESFSEIGRRFEAAHPGVRVRFGFGPSSGLARQIDQGAPADVFAAASGQTMDTVVRAGEASGPVTFARNTLEIAVPPDDPGHVTGLRDLARPGLAVAVCQPQVPCGAVAREAFAKAGVTVRPRTLGSDVRAVLTTVELGEVDAGVVYRTDVRAAGGKVRGVAIPADWNASTSYPIAVLTRSAGSAAARAFVAFVRSDTGRAVLAGAGFDPP
ncbi:MAG TPA: molybdate ABC transporter substrate-binding protein [Frankiaceae bacterium]|nr:molybdate ABC transporter substrate-binding protein [Frankiaceae bacterium]